MARQAPSADPKPTTTASPDDRGTAFRPVEGGTELQSGERLLVEAYAAIWVVIFALLFVSWRRQKKLDARVTALEGALSRARAAKGG